MTTVSQILDQKGREVATVTPDSSVFEAIKKMSENDIGSVAVVENGKLVGIFTERHYARRVFLKGKASPDTRVTDVMARDPICVLPQQTVDECMAIMTDKSIRHLPVIENNKMVGMISIGDLVKSKIENQEFIINQLEHYIRGG